MGRTGNGSIITPIHLHPNYKLWMENSWGKLLNLGINYHPCLATMFFQKDLKKEYEIYCQDFYSLILPLLDAWVYKNMQKYLTNKELIIEIEDFLDGEKKY